ncbi:hypothetical protein Tco_0461008 [Tanacetum coccineum]
MASDGSDQDAKYALSRLLQKGTVADYQNEFEMVISEAFGLARVAEAHVQDLEETIRHKSNKVEAVKTNDAIPPISADTFGSNGGNDSRSQGSRTPAKEVVDNGNGSTIIFLVGYDTESEVVTGLPRKFQEGDMVDALSRVKQKTSEN